MDLGGRRSPLSPGGRPAVGRRRGAGVTGSVRSESVDTQRLDQILQDDYLGDLQQRPIDEIRSMRAECQELETGLSYVRRVVQGRLDIVGSEASHRAAGGEPGTAADVVARLPEILSDKVHAPGLGRLQQVLAPGDLGGLVGDVDAIASPDRLADLAALSDEELSELTHRFTAYEEEVSTRRRGLHDRIDALQAELTRRYKTGEASVESLLK